MFLRAAYTINDNAYLMFKYLMHYSLLAERNSLLCQLLVVNVLSTNVLWPCVDTFSIYFVYHVSLLIKYHRV